MVQHGNIMGMSLGCLETGYGPPTSTNLMGNMRFQTTCWGTVCLDKAIDWLKGKSAG